MSRHVVINGRELSMNDAGFIDPQDATRICKQWLELMGEEDA